MSKKTVAVVFGGASSEYEISLLSSASILRNLSREKYDIICLGITKEGRWYLYSGNVDDIASGAWVNDPDNVQAFISPDPNTHGIVAFYPDGVKTIPVDVIFPVLHGKNGEDGTIQGLFTMSGIPFVGCHTFASSVCMDKAATHTILSANRIEQTPYLWFYADRYEDPEGRVIIRKKVNARLNFPVFVKPANAGSSVGISKVNSMDELDEAVAKAAKEDVKIVIEEGVIGQEVECAVLGNREAKASVVGEIGTTAAFYDYDDKYKNGTSQLYIPARLSDEISEEIRRTAVRAYRLLGCAGLSRVDFFVTPEGRIILNEINTLPGFTAISMYPKLWEATGLAYGDLLDQLVELAEQA
jgi:D-alanine-D-alanine ligase